MIGFRGFRFCKAVKVRNSVVVGRRHPKKSNHVKGWYGLGQVRSPSDFDGLDALGRGFLDHKLVPQVMGMLANKKK
jgi:hypothetical protein